MFAPLAGLQVTSALRLAPSRRRRLGASTGIISATSSSLTLRALFPDRMSDFNVSMSYWISSPARRIVIWRFLSPFLTSPTTAPLNAAETCSPASLRVMPASPSASRSYMTRKVRTVISRLARTSVTDLTESSFSLTLAAALRNAARSSAKMFMASSASDPDRTALMRWAIG